LLDMGFAASKLNANCWLKNGSTEGLGNDQCISASLIQ
jgi:hypothetical protein